MPLLADDVECQEILEKGHRTAKQHGILAGVGFGFGILFFAFTSRIPLKKGVPFAVLGFMSGYTGVSHISFGALRDHLQLERMIDSMRRAEERKLRLLRLYQASLKVGKT